MTRIPLAAWADPRFFAGAIHIEETDGGLLPHRLPRHLFAAIEGSDILAARARCGAGVRLRFATNARTLEMAFHFPQPSVTARYAMSLFLDGSFHSAFGPERPERLFRHRLPEQAGAAWRKIELWWPVYAECHLAEIRAEPEAAFRPASAQIPAAPLLLCLGDSITQGASCEFPHNAYAAVLARELGFRLHNGGIGSAVMDSVLADWRGAVPFDLALVAFGTNDFGQQRSPAGFRSATRLTLERLREERPGAPLVVVTPLPRSGALPEIRSGDLEAYRRLLRESVEGIPRLLLLEGPDLLPEGTIHMPDGVHPVDEDHQRFGRRAASRIARFLDDEQSRGM